jgi:hypothetical protein
MFGAGILSSRLDTTNRSGMGGGIHQREAFALARTNLGAKMMAYSANCDVFLEISNCQYCTIVVPKYRFEQPCGTDRRSGSGC